MAENTKSILFLCVANSCRSQMAEAIAKKRFPSSFLIESAGEMPAQQIDPGARAFLEAKGYDLTGQRPKHIDQVMALDAYDAVIALCAEACVVLPNRQKAPENWNIEDPSGRGETQGYEAAYNKIERRIDQLLESLAE